MKRVDQGRMKDANESTSGHLKKLMVKNPSRPIVWFGMNSFSSS